MVELMIPATESSTARQPAGFEDKLILITQGRTTGRSEAALLAYRRINNDYLVVASSIGSKVKPDWYLNLKEDASVRVELRDTSFHAKAWTPTGTDRVRLLPYVRDMIKSTDTTIPRKTAAILLSPVI